MFKRMFKTLVLIVIALGAVAGPGRGAALRTILAGGEFDSPADAPGARLDAGGDFPFVGALEVSDGVSSFRGPAVALSPEWIVTAAHNADFNDDGLPDPGWSGGLHLPGYGSFGIAEAIPHPAFSGFANPVVNDDLALMRLASPLPPGLMYPGFGSAVLGNRITLVGFGRSGFGSYGYTTSAGLTDRRFGSNVIDSLDRDDEGSGAAEVFRYDFDDPATTGGPGGSLGNDLETIIGPGDSGGGAFAWDGSEWVLVGINTFTEGYGGRFGNIGGGVLVAPYEDWIVATTGIPEPGGLVLLMTGLLPLLLWRSRW